MKVYVSKKGKQYGPYTIDELRQFVKEGNFTTTDYACHDGENWVTVAQTPGLFEAEPPESPPPAPDSFDSQELPEKHVASQNTVESETYDDLKITLHEGDTVYIEMENPVPLNVLRGRLFGSVASDLRKVDIIPISEAAARLGMTRSGFLTLRKSLGIETVGYKVNWPTVIKRIEESKTTNRKINAD
jgi:hypothetical protein